MSELRSTLLTDGSSDRVLLPVINWLMKQHQRQHVFQPTVWSDLRQLRYPPKTLGEKLIATANLYPCEILFVHRDAENEALEHRKSEILNAFTAAHKRMTPVPSVVCIIPIRMQEAWFLFNEIAIRKASGNPNGTTGLDLPDLSKVEKLPDPKSKLHAALKSASEKRGRDLERFNPAKEAYRVANEIDDFSPLRHLSAFQVLENDVIQLIAALS